MDYHHGDIVTVYDRVWKVSLLCRPQCVLLYPVGRDGEPLKLGAEQFEGAVRRGYRTSVTVGRQHCEWGRSKGSTRV